MKKYPEDVMKVYRLFLEYTEEVEDIICRFQRESERFGERIMKLIEPMGVDVEGDGRCKVIDDNHFCSANYFDINGFCHSPLRGLDERGIKAGCCYNLCNFFKQTNKERKEVEVDESEPH